MLYRASKAAVSIRAEGTTQADDVIVPSGKYELELELEFYLLDRQLHNICEIIRKCEIILIGDS